MEKNACPTQEIEIKQDRKIIHTDNLTFPWNQDPKGYFLVKIENNKMHCGFVTKNHKMQIEFRGTNPDKMIKEITKRKLCSKENLAYIAQELMIASHHMKNNKPYTQR